MITEAAWATFRLAPGLLSRYADAFVELGGVDLSCQQIEEGHAVRAYGSISC